MHISQAELEKKQAFLFDIHGVLLEKEEALPENQRLDGLDPFAVRNRLLTQSCPFCNDKPCSVAGEKFPHVMMQICVGKYSWEELAAHIEHILQKDSYSPEVVDAARKAADLTYFLSTRAPLAKGVELLSFLHTHVGPEKLYILSNASSQTYEAYREKFPTVFSLVPKDNVFLSGAAGVVKPDHRIFQRFLETYSLEPVQCLFFDDSKANVEAARQCGIDAFLFE